MKPPSLLDTHDAPLWASDAAGRRAIGRFAGLLYAVGSLAALPAYQLMRNPTPDLAVQLLPLLGFASGLACFLLPWDRIPKNWFHLVPVMGTLQIAVSIWALGPHGIAVAWYYSFTVGVAPLAFRERWAVAAHMGVVTLALAAPIAYAPHSARESLVRLLVAAPTMATTAAVVTFLRERLEAGQSSLRDTAGRDPLTGVGNYRTLHERLSYEIARHERSGRRFTLTLLDLDDFKQVNERFGHLEGDRVLREVGHVLLTELRGHDTVARQGGDEFSILAPESGPVDARALAERIRRELRKVRVEGAPVGTSIGCAVYPDHGETAEMLLAHADSALFAAKHEARRRANGSAEAYAPATGGAVGSVPSLPEYSRAR
jgi:diguanylate cyclase (GGDEF)-like protein